MPSHVFLPSSYDQPITEISSSTLKREFIDTVGSTNLGTYVADESSFLDGF